MVPHAAHVSVVARHGIRFIFTACLRVTTIVCASFPIITIGRTGGNTGSIGAGTDVSTCVRVITFDGVGCVGTTGAGITIIVGTAVPVLTIEDKGSDTKSI